MTDKQYAKKCKLLGINNKDIDIILSSYRDNDSVERLLAIDKSIEATQLLKIAASEMTAGEYASYTESLLAFSKFFGKDRAVQVIQDNVAYAGMRNPTNSNDTGLRCEFYFNNKGETFEISKNLKIHQDEQCNVFITYTYDDEETVLSIINTMIFEYNTMYVFEYDSDRDKYYEYEIEYSNIKDIRPIKTGRQLTDEEIEYITASTVNFYFTR